MAVSSFVLETEIRFFRENLAKWMEGHLDRVALVKGSVLIGFFDNEDAALKQGASLFGLSPFLIRRVSLEEQIIFAPTDSRGILRAIC